MYCQTPTEGENQTEDYMFKYLIRTLAAAMALAFQAHSAVLLNFFPVTDYNANPAIMDATLGTTGFTIDGFETTTLIPGLTITLSGGIPLTTFTVLPALFDQASCGSLSDNSTWDGTHGVLNTTTNTISPCTGGPNISTLMTLNYAPGTASFGVGFGNFQSLSFPSIPITNHELFVNGVDMGVIETLAGANWTPGLARNGYLRIDGTGGTLITSVSIQNLSAPDVLVLDHVAVKAAAVTPEPRMVLLLAVALLGLGIRYRNGLQAG
jgi:hypothetical protein